MNQLQITEHVNQRVLTTHQLAESFGAETQILVNNFNRNRNRYTELKHYIALQGKEKRDFINLHQIELGSKNASILYLWTEKGAWLHAKSLGTDQAWEAYEMLVDDYYDVKQSQLDLNQLSPEVRALIQIEMRQKHVEEELSETRNEMKELKKGLIDIDVPLRKQFNDAVRKLSSKSGLAFDEAYNKVYDMINAQNKVDIKRRVENRKAKGDTKVRPIDIIEELNLLVKAIRIAKVLASMEG
jgi:hypothetical protein